MIGLMIALSAAVSLGVLTAPAGASVMGTPVSSSTVTATQETTGVFSFGGSTASCTTETFSGSLGNPIEELEVSATYSGCTAFGFAGATINMNSCVYRLYGGSEASENVFSGAISVICPKEKAIVVKASAFGSECEVKIGSQEFATKATYVNHPAASPKANATLEAALTELKYTVAKDTGICPLSGTGEKSNGQYAGNWLIKAESGGSAVEFLFWNATTLCKEKLLPCPFKPVNKRYPKGEFLKAKATDWKIVGVYNLGTPTPITVTCATSVLSGTSSEETNGWFSSSLKAKFPTFTTENCKDELNNTCTVTPQGVNLNYTGYFRAVAAGNGRLEFFPHFVIECGNRWKCAYEKNLAELTVIGGLGNAYAEAALLQLIPNPSYVGIACGSNATNEKATWTATYFFEEPTNLFLSET